MGIEALRSLVQLEGFVERWRRPVQKESFPRFCIFLSRILYQSQTSICSAQIVLVHTCLRIGASGREVRFVIKVDPTQTIEGKGVLLEIMSKIIIDKVYLSPEMPFAENLNLHRFSYEKRVSRNFFQAGQEPRPRSPLAEADLPSGVFPDLD